MNNRGHNTGSQAWKEWDEQQPIFEKFDDTPHLTHDDLCKLGKAGPKCPCDYCREMVARERDEDNRI